MIKTDDLIADALSLLVKVRDDLEYLIDADIYAYKGTKANNKFKSGIPPLPIT